MTQPVELGAGVVLDGKYRLVAPIGRGAMGEVWAASHASLGRSLAIKIIHRKAAAEPEALMRFRNEARAAALLESRFIVQVLDDGETSDGRAYIVMERLLGESLQTRLDRDKVLEPEVLLPVLRDVCRGLEKAHGAGIVHRDLKPDNIFLHKGPDDDRETAKLLDFGVAKMADKGATPQSITSTGSLLGTPWFMSPEQVKGEKPIDGRTDVWSLGVVVYRALTGEMPWRNDGLGHIFMSICSSPPEPLTRRRPSLPLAFDAFMSRALAKARDQRYQSATELLEAFERVVEGKVVSAVPATAPPTTDQPSTIDNLAEQPTLDFQPALALPQSAVATVPDRADATRREPGALPVLPLSPATDAKPSALPLSLADTVNIDRPTQLSAHDLPPPALAPTLQSPQNPAAAAPTLQSQQSPAAAAPPAAPPAQAQQAPPAHVPRPARPVAPVPQATPDDEQEGFFSWQLKLVIALLALFGIAAATAIGLGVGTHRDDPPPSKGRLSRQGDETPPDRLDLAQVGRTERVVGAPQLEGRDEAALYANRHQHHRPERLLAPEPRRDRPVHDAAVGAPQQRPAPPRRLDRRVVMREHQAEHPVCIDAVAAGAHQADMRLPVSIDDAHLRAGALDRVLQRQQARLSEISGPRPPRRLSPHPTACATPRAPRRPGASPSSLVA